MERLCLILSCFDVGVCLLNQCVGVFHLVSGFLSEGFVLYVAVDLVCLWKEGTFRSLLCHHLDLELLKLAVNNKK